MTIIGIVCSYNKKVVNYQQSLPVGEAFAAELR